MSGPYEIRIGNGQGEDVKLCNITMQDVPSPPQEIQISEIFQTSCVVSWKPSKDDGGSPIQHYVIERQDISLKSGWDNVGQISPKEPSTYKVEGLTPKKEYRFRIRAVNKLGTSEPTVFSKPILAKDPWGT